MNTEIKITGSPKESNESFEMINEDVHAYEFALYIDDGLNISGIKMNDDRVHFIEVSEKTAIEIAKTILHFYGLDN
jgi:cupin superfamily acireductone dioxygenase involved in methionine salvage